MYKSSILRETIQNIVPLDGAVMKYAGKHWNSLAKPLHSLGDLESMIIQMAGIQRTLNIRLKKKVLVTFCADHGVVEEGVSQTDSSVTAKVAENFLKGESTASIFCRRTGTEHLVVDIGMAESIGKASTEEISKRSGIKTENGRCARFIRRKTACGTRNMRKGPAMTADQAEDALESGIYVAKEYSDADIFAVGEMGIGNTTAASAMTSVFLGKDPSEVTGRGAGLDRQRLENKIRVVEDAIRINSPDPSDAFDVLTKVGGLELAGMTGLILGAAAQGIAVVIDGFVSSAAALCAVRMCPEAEGYIMASHLSREPAAEMLLKEMHKEAVLRCGMFPGEGAGAVMLFPMLEMAWAVYAGMPFFEDVDIEAYTDYEN